VNFNAYVGVDLPAVGKGRAQYLVDHNLVKSGDLVWMPVEVPGASYGVGAGIARNLFLDREPLKGPGVFNRMDARLMEEVAGDLLRRVGIGKAIPASTPIASLSGGERQAVAIARAMHFDSDLIILDEPTNNLGVAETQGVLRFVRNARNSGHSCIFIAHNIHHVFQVVDRIVVMRRGKIVADDIDPKATSVAEVERVITGDFSGPPH